MAGRGDVYKLFVGQLPPDCQPEELQTVFATYGEVVDIHMMQVHPRTGMRCAFVCYKEQGSAEDAIKVLQSYKIRHDAVQPIAVRWASTNENGGKGDFGKGDFGKGSYGKGDYGKGDYGKGDYGKGGYGKGDYGKGDYGKGDYYKGGDFGKGKGDFGDRGDGKGDAGRPHFEGYKLFIGRLPNDISEEELRTVFSTYGEVSGIIVMKANDTGLRGAFIFYQKKESAEDAIKVLDSQYKIRVNAPETIQVLWAKSAKGAREWTGGGKESFGKGKDKGWHGAGWEPRGYDSRWQGGGDWEGNWRDGGKGGYGDWPPAGGKGGWQEKGAWRGGHQEPWQQEGDEYGRYGKGDKGDGKGGGKFDGKGGGKGGWDEGKGGAEAMSPTKLYVSNLPEDIDNKALEYVFNTYGKVESIHLMTNKQVNGCISAFVEFSTAAEAESALAALNQPQGYEIREGYGPLIVKHATNRPKPY